MHTSSSERIFSDIAIVHKSQVYVQWILPEVNYAFEICNLTKALVHGFGQKMENSVSFSLTQKKRRKCV